MHQPRTVVIVLAATWGIAATWIFWWLYGSVFWTLLIAFQPTVNALLHSGWSSDQLGLYLGTGIQVGAALFYGLIFGVPLAFVAKSALVPAWGTFVVAFLIALAVRMSLVQSSLDNLVSPMYLLTFLTTLLFAFVVYRVRSVHASRAAV